MSHPEEPIDKDEQIRLLKEVLGLYAHGPNWHEFGFRSEWRDRTHFGQFLAQAALKELDGDGS